MHARADNGFEQVFPSFEARQRHRIREAAFFTFFVFFFFGMFPEDHGVFLADFGVDARFETRAGETLDARGIFDCAEMDGDLGKGAKIVAVQPRLSLPLAAIPRVARGDSVTLTDANVFPDGSARFRVLEIINEGTGWATLPLAPCA